MNAQNFKQLFVVLFFVLTLWADNPVDAQYAAVPEPYQVHVLCIWGDADKNPSNVQTVKTTEEHLMKFFDNIRKKWNEDDKKTGKKRTLTIESLYGSKTSRDEILSKCREISQKAGPDDVVFVYVLCHGGHLKGSLEHSHFFIPTAKGTSGTSFSKEDYIYRKEIQDILEENEHRLNILITDTCGHVTSKKSVGSSSRGILTKIPEFPAYDSIFNDFVGSININSTSWKGGSGQNGETAIGSNDYGTAFTRALISTLQQESQPWRYTKPKFLEALQQETNQSFRELKSSFEKNGDDMFISLSEQETQSISEYDEDGNAIEKKE